jgi:Nse1 non-SMC component of SMC5-6 complex
MTTEALSGAQQMFNQRLLAAHCLGEREAVQLYESILQECDDSNATPFADSLAASNAQLQHLGLEIVAVSLPRQQQLRTNKGSNNNNNGEEEDYDDDDADDADGASSPSSAQQKQQYERHFAMVNKFPDDVAKVAFQHSSIFHQQQRYVKAVLEKLVVEGPSLSRADLINVKNDLKNQKKNRQGDDEDDGTGGGGVVTLGTAEATLEHMLDEKWVVEVVVAKNDGSKRRRKGRNAATLIAIGPRTYCELSHMLTDEFGLDPADLPQQICYRL